MSSMLPFSVAAIPWTELSEPDRRFFCFQDDYLPLPAAHAAQIRLVAPEDGGRVRQWAWAAIPHGWPDATEHRFPAEQKLNIQNCWNEERELARVRQWLHDRGIPFEREIYLLFDHDQVVQTTWKILVRYWDAFAWSVGYAMVAVDSTLQWAICFHHEEVIVFGTKVTDRT